MEQKVSVKQDQQAARPWRVSVGSVSASFKTEQEATVYARTLEQRLAPGLASLPQAGKVPGR